MARSSSTSRTTTPNEAFRSLRGGLSPGEFAAAVRRAAREIGERVSCDARYVGRVEAGEIRCPNYAYERVFLHMFPGRTLTDLGFEPRQTVRGRGARAIPPPRAEPIPPHRTPRAFDGQRPSRHGRDAAPPGEHIHDTEEGDVLRRAFMTGGPAAIASLAALGSAPHASAAGRGRPGAAEVARVRQAVRDIRLLDDQHGALALYRPAGEALRTAYELLDTGAKRSAVDDELHSNTGELAISVGWLAHDSRRWVEARSYYAEALATARVGGDPALEAHAFCNTAFLARDTGRPREAVRAAQAGARAARQVGSERLRSLLALREAAGWAGMGDRGGTEQAIAQAQRAYERGEPPESPEWMTFFGDGEFASLEGQCWALLGDWRRAAECAGSAVEAARRDPHFARNIALYSAELAGCLARSGRPEEAAAVGSQTLDLMDQVRSTRITELLADTATRLHPARRDAGVAAFLERQRSGPV
ncbi:hypothetical protein FH609_000560 [Streptomyces sp. 3MP-14]|uniref:Tetratricopeptide repeat protein n=1 Tax=Streptomyces mimosae TaxID=2586635 RepID=A0A5N6ATQ1_9ACTN|nr:MULTISPECIES: hypothetical protein [Streptomyces]KAB8171098.1 hypothetical protein FH607_001910 [Streptomyces mimosae]KAB8179550.1 hypothetical protein FH609_000560 [Streptomyces sp. 3MP-14]